MYKEIVLFGAGEICKKICEQKGEQIKAVIDNDPNKVGNIIGKSIPIISLDCYKEEYRDIPIIISTFHSQEIIKQLLNNGITNYSLAPELWKSGEVMVSQKISHSNWSTYLKELCDKEGMDILEVGSRTVTGSCFRGLFEKANYVGFDYYAGDNVDVVGDAHKLSQYFDKKFDLIFSSAVFEHLAMPWQASLEMIKLLKPGGYIFIETHYSYSSHERPWHFFQYSENALNVLFPERFGITCLEKGCSNLIEGHFSQEAAEYLRGKMVSDLYCHSEFLGQKTKEIPEAELTWNGITLEDVVGSTRYPLKKENR